MYSGEIKKVQDIVAGDKLMGPDSKPRRVLSTCSGVDTLYKIIPKKGIPFIVNSCHVLTLFMSPDGKSKDDNEIIDIPLDKYLKKSKWFKHRAKGFRVGVSFKSQRKLHPKITPYFLGIWLGDGHKNLAAISNPDKEILSYIKKTALKNGLKIRDVPCGQAVTRHIACKKIYGRGHKRNIILNALRDLDLINNKHIPRQYLVTSRKNRLELLAGLLDSDGHMRQSGFDFVNKNKSISEGVCFLARSLGLAAYMKPCFKSSQNGTRGKYYRIYISGDCSVIPNKVKRKKAPKRKQIKNHLRFGFEVEKLKKGKYYGFELDKDGRFLLGDFTVTHNTLCFAAICKEILKRRPDSRVLILINKTVLIDQTIDKIKKMIPENTPEIGVYCGSLGLRVLKKTIDISMIQSIHKKIILPKYDLCIVDEYHNFEGIETFEKVKKKLPNTKFIYFTATPFKGGKPLKAPIIYRSYLDDMISKGYLVPYTFVASKENFDLSALEIRGDDYTKASLSEIARDEAKIKVQVEDALPRLVGRKKIVWACIDIDHAKKVHSHLSFLKERASITHSKMSDEENKYQMLEFEYMDARHLVSVMKVVEGYDHPPIDAIVCMRPTRSANLYVQLLGRGLRLSSGKENLLFLDYGGVVEALGSPSRPVLLGKESTTREETTVICPACRNIMIVKITPKTCKECDYAFSSSEQRESDEKLQNLTLKAYEPGLSIKTVDVKEVVIVKEHISKSGNKCIRVDYKTENFFETYSDFLMYEPNNFYARKKKAFYRANKRRVYDAKKIVVKRNPGTNYWSVTEVIY